MKTLTRISILCLLCLAAGVSKSSGQGTEGYIFFSNEFGPQICIGAWVPARDVGLPGYCDGQVMPLYQLNALSAKQTVDRLDKALTSLDSMNEKLALSNEQMSALLEASAGTRDMISDYTRVVSEFLQDAISQRFDQMPKEIMGNDLFRQELARLKADILKEVEKHYSKLPSSQKK